MFRENRAPDDMPEFRLAPEDGGVWIVRALREAGLAASGGDARRKIKQKAVRVDGERVEADDLTLPERPEPYQVQVGKRAWARIRVAPE